MKISIKDFSFVRISSRIVRAYWCGTSAATFKLSSFGSWGMHDWTCGADFLQPLCYAFEDYISSND
jgi:hypothetical protein